MHSGISTYLLMLLYGVSVSSVPTNPSLRKRTCLRKSTLLIELTLMNLIIEFLLNVIDIVFVWAQ